MGKQHITIVVDDDLLASVDEAAELERGSRNAFIVEALEHHMRELGRERVDTAFARMAADPEYQAELQRIEDELAPASDAAWLHLDAAESPARSGN